MFTGCAIGEGGQDHLGRKNHLVLLTGYQGKEVPLIHRRTGEMPTKCNKKCGGEVRKGRRKQSSRVMSVHVWLSVGKIKGLM